MSLIEERLRFQELEKTGKLHGARSQVRDLRPNEQRHHYSPRPIQGEKGFQQWVDYEKQKIRPTYLGNNDKYAQLTATMTDQPVSRLPYAPRRPQTLNFIPRPPPVNTKRQPNPLYCSKSQAESAAKGKASRSVAPKLNFNPITQDPTAMGNGYGNLGPQPDARIQKLAQLRSQDWSMFMPQNPSGGSASSSGYGKAAMRPCGGGSSAVGLISGSDKMNIGFTGQSERDYNKKSERMKRGRAGEVGESSNRKLTGMQSSGMMSILGYPNLQAEYPKNQQNSRRIGLTSLHSPRTRLNGGINPITGRAFDSNVEEQRNKAEQDLRNRNLKRDTTGKKTREDVSSLLTVRAGMDPNWLPSSKKVTQAQITQYPPAASRTSYFTQSKRVYAQANRTSDWNSGPAITPRSGSQYRPKDRGSDIIFAGGGKIKSKLLGPRVVHDLSTFGLARPGFHANSSRF